MYQLQLIGRDVKRELTFMLLSDIESNSDMAENRSWK